MCHISMDELSDGVAEIARKNHSFILRRLAQHGQKTIADKVDISESKMSRLKGSKEEAGELELFAIICAFMNIKLVDNEAIFCDVEMIDATSVLLSRAYRAPDFLKRLMSSGKKIADK